MCNDIPSIVKALMPYTPLKPRTFIVALGCFLAAGVDAQFSAAIPIDPADFITVGDLKFFDLNGDTHNDLIVGTTTHDHRIIWYQNDGTGHYSRASKLVRVEELPTDIEFGDVNSDGHPDIVYAQPSSGTIGWCRNNGETGFIAMPPLLDGVADVLDLSLIDVDGDSDPDIVAHAGSTGQFISSINSDGIFSTPTSLASATSLSRHACGDVNGDGISDLILYGPTLQVFLGSSTAGWGLGSPLPSINLPVVHVLRLQDFDLDSDLDILMWSQQMFYCAFNDGTGGFPQAEVLMDQSPGLFFDQHASDFDGDGDVDLAWRKIISGVSRYQWSPNTGGGTWGPPQDFHPGNVASVAVANADGDGDVEIAFATVSSALTVSGINGPISESCDTISRHTRGRPTELIASDINGDGLLDLLESSWNGDACWFPGIDGTSWGEAVPIYKYTNSCYAIRAGDIDGDGDNDVTTWGGGTLGGRRIHINDGQGGFSPGQTVGLNSSPYSSNTILKDIDSDGDLDLFPGSALCVFLNTDGTYDECSPLGTPNPTNIICDLVLTDINNDSILDVAYTLNQQSQWRYRIRDSNGSTGSDVVIPMTHGFASACRFIEPGDLDGDGDIDMVISSPGNGTSYLGWMENLGSDQWSQMHIISTAEGISQVGRQVVSDIDSDGDLDIVAGISSTFEAGYFLNNGSGEFAPIQVFNSSGAVWMVADLNGDGWKDALVPGSDYSMVHINLFGSPYRLEGSIFHDANNDGQRSPEEDGLPFRPVLTTPFGEQRYTNSTGTYSAMATAGPNSVSTQFLSSFWNLSSDSASYHTFLTPDSPISSENNFGYVPLIDTTLIQPSITLSSSRCDFTVSGWISLLNSGSTQASGVLIAEWDTLMTFLSSIPPPDSVIGPFCYWTIDTLNYWELRSIECAVQMPSAVYAGDSVSARVSFQVNDPATEVVFQGYWSETVACSFDPNDKRVSPTGYGTEGCIPFNTEWLDYTIRFQNTGTAPALNVVVNDLLSEHLDRSSLELIGISHVLTELHIRPDGVAVFRFDGIELPDSTSDEPRSHGFIRYRIRPSPYSVHGTVIPNTAVIYFDSNEPVITNTTISTLVDCGLWHPTIAFVETDLLEATQGHSYVWYLNGVPLPNDNSSTLFVYQPGTYTVQVTNSCGCMAMSEPYQVITTNVNPNWASRGTIIPNPLQTSARFLFSDVLSQQHVIEVIDLHGKVQKFMQGKGNKELVFDREGLSSGLYMLRVRQGSQQLFTTRFVID